MKTFASMLLATGLAAIAPAQAGQWTTVGFATATGPIPASMTPTAGLTYDPLRQVFVFAGGNGSSSNRLFEWTNGAWSERLQHAQDFAASAWHPNLGRTVVLASSGAGYTTMTWDGSSLTALPARDRIPAGAWLFGMHWDPASQRLVAIGSDPVPTGRRTWVYDGNTWSAQAAWPSLASPWLVADPLTQQLVLLAGGSAPAAFVWLGTAWSQLPMPLPTGTWNGVAASAQWILIADNNQHVWRWDGVVWQALATEPNGPASAFAFAAGASGFLAVCGTHTLTLQLIPPVQAAFATFGSGCPGPAGTLDLQLVGTAPPRIGETLRLSVTNVPTTLFNRVYGFLGNSSTSGTAPRCRST